MSLALVVDDSKTAQARLKSLLKHYDLTVDFASSAEQALAYLSYKQPAIIFLDHQMEGMDGLEALRIIKANPATATIPVVMYTSQQGDVYLGQARALGALDIINKQVVKAESIERLLSGLKIKKRASKSATPSAKPSNASSANTVKVSQSSEAQRTHKAGVATASPEQARDKDWPSRQTSDLNEVRAQVARLFELHISDVRQQIAEHSRFVVKNLLAEIRRKEPAQAKESANQSESSAEKEDSQENAGVASEQRPSRGAGYMIAACVLVLVCFVYVVFEMKRTRELVESLQSANLIEQIQLAELGAAIEDVAAELDFDLPESEVPALTFETIAWAINADLHFGYAEPPFGERQVNTLKDLFLRLNLADFRGEALITLHFGDFCVVNVQEGAPQLPAPNTDISGCQLLSTMGRVFTADRFVNDAFIEFEQTTASIIDGHVSLSLMSAGLATQPERNVVNAGEWNKAAAQNNRINVTLIADVE